jgi:non-heme chloroperoxidase
MEAKSEVVKVGGLAVEHYAAQTEKDPVPILFCHGTGSGSYIWKNFCQYFSKKGWQAYAVNYRGHYLSDPVANLGDCRFMDYVDDVEAVVKYLGKDPYLFGHSLGGIVVQKYAERKDPAKLFLIDSGTCKALTERLDFSVVTKNIFGKACYVQRGDLVGIEDDPSKIEATKAALKEMLFAEGMVDDEVLEELLRVKGWESRQAAMESGSTPVDPTKVTCPVYVIGKEKGFTTDMPTNQWLAEYYGAKDMKIFEPMGHCFMQERNWESYARIIEEWLLES